MNGRRLLTKRSLRSGPVFSDGLQAGAGDKRTLDELIERAARWARSKIERESFWKRTWNQLAPHTIDQDKKKTLAMGVEREAFSQLADTHRNWLSDVESAFVAKSDREHKAAGALRRRLMFYSYFLLGLFTVSVWWILTVNNKRLLETNTILEEARREVKRARDAEQNALDRLRAMRSK